MKKIILFIILSSNFSIADETIGSCKWRKDKVMICKSKERICLIMFYEKNEIRFKCIEP